MDRFITMHNFKFGGKHPAVLDMEVYAYKVLLTPKVSKIQFKQLLYQKKGATFLSLMDRKEFTQGSINIH